MPTSDSVNLHKDGQSNMDDAKSWDGSSTSAIISVESQSSHGSSGKLSSSKDEIDDGVNTYNETPAQRRARHISIWIVHCGMFIFALGFSVVITGVYPYMKLVCFSFRDRN